MPKASYFRISCKDIKCFDILSYLIGFYLLESQSEVIDNITGCNVFFSRLPSSYVSGNSVEVHAYDGGIFGGVSLCQ